MAKIKTKALLVIMTMAVFTTTVFAQSAIELQQKALQERSKAQEQSIQQRHAPPASAAVVSATPSPQPSSTPNLPVKNNEP